MSTPTQNAVAEALTTLKFDDKGADMPGSPVKFEVTDETLEFLKGKTFSVNAEGNVEFN